MHESFKTLTSLNLLCDYCLSIMIIVCYMYLCQEFFLHIFKYLMMKVIVKYKIN